MIKIGMFFLATIVALPFSALAQNSQIEFLSANSGLIIGGLSFEKQELNGEGETLFGVESTLSGSRIAVANRDHYGNLTTGFYRIGLRGGLSGKQSSAAENNLGLSAFIHIRSAVGFDLSDLEEGVGPYLSVLGGSITGGGDYDQKQSGHLSGFVGPETGIRYFADDMVVFIAPSVGWGHGLISTGNYDGLTVNAENWAYGGRLVANIKAVEVYGDFFKVLPRTDWRDLEHSGMGGNAEVRVGISDKLTLLGYWEFLKVTQELGYEVRDANDRVINVPGDVFSAERNKVSAAIEWKFQDM